MALPQLVLSAAALPFAGAQGALAVLISDVSWDTRLTGPLSVLNFLNLAMRSGILVKDGRALELLSKVNTVVFDKTGTLTLEQPELGRIHVCAGIDEDAVLRYAASAERRQAHPFARAILQAAEARGLALGSIQDTLYEEGFGIQTRFEDKPVHVGSDTVPEYGRDWPACRMAGGCRQEEARPGVFVCLVWRWTGVRSA